jgi:hypothetical protein
MHNFFSNKQLSYPSVDNGNHVKTRMNIIIALMMEAVRTSKASACFNDTTKHYIPETYHLQLPCCHVTATFEQAPYGQKLLSEI